jgi:hypothetical protein
VSVRLGSILREFDRDDQGWQEDIARWVSLIVPVRIPAMIEKFRKKEKSLINLNGL